MRLRAQRHGTEALGLPQVSLLQILAQFGGGLFTALFILDGWHHGVLWVLFALFSLIPAAVEAFVLVGVLGLGLIKY